MKQPTFADRLARWLPELLHKEKAALLGVPLETFRGWLYGKHEPSHFVMEEIEKRMEERHT